MGYQLIDVEDAEPLPNRSSTGLEVSDHYVPPEGLDDAEEKRGDKSGTGPKKIGLRLYYVDPGEKLAKRYHYHEEQEEVFFVLEGTLHIKTPKKTYQVNPNQAFVVEPGNPQKTFNPENADEQARVLTIGAPSYSILGGNDAHEYDPNTEE